MYCCPDTRDNRLLCAHRLDHSKDVGFAFRDAVAPPIGYNNTMPRSAPPPNTTARRLIWRRLFQFRLRTLLLLTTIMAIWLGWWSHKALQQREAVAVLRSHGAIMFYNHMLPGQVEAESKPFGDERPGFSQWLVNRVGIDYFGSVGAVHFSTDFKVRDRDMELLRSLSSLEWLWLNYTGVTDAGLAHLTHLKNLDTLDLEYTRITDAGLEHLTGLSNLKELRLRGTQVTAAGVARLQKALPNCNIER
ncbi:MAG: hypothetical protein K8T91_28470 [Planctomycetes bacterium]|nr:hypothetical protein [Planctomycetota bacterium]